MTRVGFGRQGEGHSPTGGMAYTEGRPSCWPLTEDWVMGERTWIKAQDERQGQAWGQEFTVFVK